MNRTQVTQAEIADGLARQHLSEEDYVHSREVAARFLSDSYVALALLHDVIENTRGLHEHDLATAGVERSIRDDLYVLTRRVDEPYNGYINRIVTSGSRRAVFVKLSDARANLRRSKGTTLARRYERVIARLSAWLADNPDTSQLPV